jgi:RNA polymerase sigma-70 factor (ECF subfamily)
VEELQSSLSAEHSSETRTAADRLEDSELATIRAAVNSLPHDQRLALEMAFFAGLTHAEIAEATGEPLGTIKARIRRGMLKLRDLLHAVHP